MKKYIANFIVCSLFVFLNSYIIQADEILDDYMTRAFNYKLEIIHKASNFKSSARKARYQEKVESLEKSYRGRVPRDM